MMQVDDEAKMYKLRGWRTTQYRKQGRHTFDFDFDQIDITRAPDVYNYFQSRYDIDPESDDLRRDAIGQLAATDARWVTEADVIWPGNKLHFGISFAPIWFRIGMWTYVFIIDEA